MKRKWLQKGGAVMMAALTAASVLAGCGNTEVPSEANAAGTKEVAGESGETASQTSDIDISEHVDVVGYLLGEAPAGMDDVMNAVNEKLEKDLNASLEIRYLSWGEYTAKYPLLLAAGDDIDFIFTADWCMYSQEATKNAFYELTEDELKTYMPLHWQNCAPIAWDVSKVNGKNYMITTCTPDRRCDVAAYRKDLCDKYNVTAPTKMSEFTDYLAAIKENESDIVPMNMDSQYDLGSPFGALRNEYGDRYEDANHLGIFWNAESDDGQFTPIYEGAVRESYKYAADIMKQWYDAGYINKDVFSNDVRSKDAFLEGKSAVAFGNSVDMQSFLVSAKDKGYEVGIVPLLDKQGHSLATSYLNNGVGIAATSEHPQRTMMVLDKIMEDPEYNYLVYYGIEGKNYVITEDQKIGLPDGVTADNNDYPADAAGFWFTNKDQFLPSATWSDDYIALKAQIEDGMLIDNKLTSFAPNVENVQTQVANVTNVLQQYANPMQVGMVEDTEAALTTLEEKLKAAGLEDVQAEIQKQADEYLGK
ncbi:putative aldouronate transport system substrate-binding protein [Butyrivibrio sp. Su6]|uniref:DUF3502 domain-containing protein n=1 Tax=Butyrivibrio sp. Su6 TaxID=1520810 RepID=UPI00089E9339|nr:DUF3502 domain-containing protein [Butyrivibrio sp. Su6]SEF57525.1 putative aldouronate transport system substrate-binding protein [Butyrivibrio sp. Su6]